MDEPLPQKSILILTEVVFGTLGDYFAAFKLIQGIQQHDPSIHVTWIIHTLNHSMIPEMAEQFFCKRYVLDNWSRLQEDDLYKNALSLADIVLLFPAFHYMDDVQRRFIVSSRYGKTPMVVCKEYDYQGAGPDDSDDVLSISSGFGSGNLGIFIEKEYASTPKAFLCHLSDGLQTLISGDTHNNQHTLYMRTVYFGYYNQEMYSVVNHISIITYIKTVMLLNRENNQTIDIISPMSLTLLRNFFQSEQSFLQQMGISTIYYEDYKTRSRFSIQGTKTTGEMIRFINPFPLKSEDMQVLMHAAEPFILCTGDQSLSEVISRQGIPYYQIMRWKQGLFSAFQTLAAEVCGSDSVLVQFLNACSGDIVKNKPEQIVAYIQDPQIKKNISDLYKYMKDNQNLYDKLPKYLIQAITTNRALINQAVETPSNCVNRTLSPDDTASGRPSFFRASALAKSDRRTDTVSRTAAGPR